MTNFIKLKIEKKIKNDAGELKGLKLMNPLMILIKIIRGFIRALSGKRFMSMQIIYPISKRSKIRYAQIIM